MRLFSQHSRNPGQSLVELALVLPLAVLILALSADFGRAFSAYIQISSMAREGAAYGMQGSDIPVSEIQRAARRELGDGDSPTIWGVAPTVTVVNCSDGMSMPDGTPYECIAVRVDYNFQPIITIGPIPSSIPMTRTVEMRVVN